MTIQVDLQLATTSSSPTHKEIDTWIKAALADKRTRAEVAVRIVDESEMTALNLQYRKKNKPTNVLSFPCTLPKAIRGDLLGDLVVCAPVVAAEAQAQHKSIDSHWAHLIVHGTLHLLGYDHENDEDAQVMENLEVQIMQTLGYSDPYHTEIIHD